MSLQARFILLYTLVIGLIVTVFGWFVYFRIELILIEQIDRTLRGNALQVINTINVDTPDSGLLSGISTFDETIIVLVWDADGTLLTAEEMQSSLIESWYHPDLQPDFESNSATYENLVKYGREFRVYTAPITTSFGRWGTVQVGVRLIDTRDFQNNLRQVLVATGGITLIVASFIVWSMTSLALLPLERATNTALKITGSQNLSIRLPESNTPDEVGKLINAFNATLERLEELFDSQRRFLADVSHELRTPLTAVKGNVGLMNRFQKFDAEALESIESEANRMTRMVEDLLLLAQADVNEVPMNIVPVELDTLLLESMQQASFAIRDATSMEIVEIDQVMVCADRDRLKQVVLNLLSNAIKYSPHGGRVEVSLGKVRREAYIRIYDNGIGIPKEDLPLIFDRFYRAEKDRTRKFADRKGFGLGLSISKWIVERHSGRIEVQSGEGKGSVFTVWLPLAGFDC